MAENEYPIPSYMADFFQKPPGWKETPKVDEPSLLASTSSPMIYAIDCEMVRDLSVFPFWLSLGYAQCLTEDGNELARVCIIDYKSKKVVYDQLVKPEKPVLDYLTRCAIIVFVRPFYLLIA
jgi:RNA exonuclease 1